jgi:hypothetical protein
MPIRTGFRTSRTPPLLLPVPHVRLGPPAFVALATPKATLDIATVPSFSRMPPRGLACVGLVWRLTMFTRSTTTRSLSVSDTQNPAALALLFPGNHDDRVALANMH